MPERELLSLPEPLTQVALCNLVARWLVEPETIRKVVLAAQDYRMTTGTDVFILSGYRTKAAQATLSRRGRPTAPDELSTHRSCLATGVDIDLGFLVANSKKALWGSAVVFRGLRWGGGSPVDPLTGIPSDWNHVDLGPRDPARRGLLGPILPA